MHRLFPYRFRRWSARRAARRAIPAAKLRVGIRFDGDTLPVGTLSHTGGRGTRFQYDSSFLRRGIDISPPHLRRRRRPQSCDIPSFRGIHGVFDDSLPDRWGDDLLAEALPNEKGFKRRDKPPPLNRLALVGDDGMGALVYEAVEAELPAPEEVKTPETAAPLDADELDRLADMAWTIEKSASYPLNKTRPADAIELLRLAGNAGGARPKILIGVADGRIVGNARRLPPASNPGCSSSKAAETGCATRTTARSNTPMR